MNKLCRVFARIVVGVLLCAIPVSAFAGELVLRAVSAFTPGTLYSRPFEQFVQFVNTEGKGIIRINYLGGGAKIMSVFEMGNALKNGVFDMVNINSAYYTNLLPESDAIKLMRHPVAEFNKNSKAWQYLEQLENKKVNAHILALSKGAVPFHYYLRKGAKIPPALNWSGLKIRSTPIYEAFLTTLGATPVRMVPGEIYTGMNRSVVDGYGWPIQGIDDLGLLGVTGYRVDPGFFVGNCELLINLNTWKKLTPEQKKVLEFAAKWLDTWLPMYEAYHNENSKLIQQKSGVKVISLKGEEAKKYLGTAYAAAWKAVLKENPSDGAHLKELIEQSADSE